MSRPVPTGTSKVPNEALSPALDGVRRTSGRAADSVENSDHLDQLDRHLASPHLCWLLGAGISYPANVPLMDALTARVLELLKKNKKKHLYKLVNALTEDLEPQGTESGARAKAWHIEHLLSHLGDYAALLRRSGRDRRINKVKASLELLEEAHSELLQGIAETVRWGFATVKGPDGTETKKIGQAGKSIIDVTGHREFIKACFSQRHGLDKRRGPLKFFTTNYDTLLEDALALESIPYWDGFEGGAVAYRSHRFGAEPPEAVSAHVVKLHGSIDWVDDGGTVRRVRHDDPYLSSNGLASRVLIHPQATKYLATQRDPFAAQFDLFRRALTPKSVLAICGYSFGDDHINDEIQIAMSRPGSQMILLAFVAELSPGENEWELPRHLEKWRRSEWGKRVYVVTQRGLYVGTDGPAFNDVDRDWWTFAGVTQILANSAASVVKRAAATGDGSAAKEERS